MVNRQKFPEWEESQVTQRLYRYLAERDEEILNQLGSSLHTPDNLARANALVGERGLIKKLLSENLVFMLFPEEGNDDKRKRS